MLGGNLAHAKVPAKILIFEFHCVDQKTAKWSTIQKITLLSQILKVWKKKVPWYGLNLAITQTFDNSPINRFSVHCSEFRAFSETASILYRFFSQLAGNQRYKGTLLSQTFKVWEKKVHSESRYGRFYVFTFQNPKISHIFRRFLPQDFPDWTFFPNFCI